MTLMVQHNLNCVGSAIKF